MCDHCRQGKGIELRQQFLSHLEVFAIPRLLTLTVDRRKYSSPEDAYTTITGEKYIPRLLTKELGVRRWFWVLEAQDNTGDGWPHWHILIDMSVLPGRWYNRTLKRKSVNRPADARGWHRIPHFLDLNKVNRLLQKWGFGGSHLSEKKRDFTSAAKAVNYITKYMIKPPKRGNPPWMLNRPRVRMYDKSRDVSRALGTKGNPSKKKADTVKPRRRSPARPPVKRIAECGYRFAIIDRGPVHSRLITSFFGDPGWLRADEDLVSIEKYDEKKNTSIKVLSGMN